MILAPWVYIACVIVGGTWREHPNEHEHLLVKEGESQDSL